MHRRVAAAIVFVEPTEKLEPIGAFFDRDMATNAPAPA